MRAFVLALLLSAFFALASMVGVGAGSASAHRSRCHERDISQAHCLRVPHLLLQAVDHFDSNS